MYPKSKSWRQRPNRRELLLSQLHAHSNSQQSNQPLPFAIQNGISHYALQKLKLLEHNIDSILQTSCDLSRRSTDKTQSIANSINSQNDSISDLIQIISQLGDASSIFLRQKVFVTALENVRELHMTRQHNTKNAENPTATEFDDVVTHTRDNRHSFTLDNTHGCTSNTVHHLTTRYPLVDIHAQMQDVKNVLEKHHRRSKLCMRHVAPICDTKAFESSTFTYNVINHKNKELQNIYETLYKCDEYDSIDIFKFDHLTDGWAMSLLLPIMFEQYNFFDSDNVGSCQLPLFVDRSVLHAFLDKIQINYFDVPYHNRIHASDVLQTAFFWLSRKDSPIIRLLNKEDIFVILISCVIHDLQHPGTSQMFLLQAEHPITRVYNDSDVLEHMHLSQAFLMIKSDENVNIFKHLNRHQIAMIKHDIIDCVLATNFAHQPKLKCEMKSFIDFHHQSSMRSHKNKFDKSISKLQQNPSYSTYSTVMQQQIEHETSIASVESNNNDLRNGIETSQLLSVTTNNQNSGDAEGVRAAINPQNIGNPSPSSVATKSSLSRLLRAPSLLTGIVRRFGNESGPNRDESIPKPKVWKGINNRLRALSALWKKKSISEEVFRQEESRSGLAARQNANSTEDMTDSSRLVNHVAEIQMAPIPIDFLDNVENSKTVVSINQTRSFEESPHKLFELTDTEDSSKLGTMWSNEISSNVHLKHESQHHNFEAVRSLLRRSIVHASDISHCAKPLLIHQEWSERYYQETYVEKHILKTMNLVQQVDMKRKDFPKEQVWFIANLAHPFFGLFCQFIKSQECRKILENVESNLNFWKNDPKASNAYEISNQQYAGFASFARQRSRLVSKTMSFNGHTTNQ